MLRVRYSDIRIREFKFRRRTSSTRERDAANRDARDNDVSTRRARDKRADSRRAATLRARDGEPTELGRRAR